MFRLVQLKSLCLEFEYYLNNEIVNINDVTNFNPTIILYDSFFSFFLSCKQKHVIRYQTIHHTVVIYCLRLFTHNIISFSYHIINGPGRSIDGIYHYTSGTTRQVDMMGFEGITWHRLLFCP